MIKYFSEATGYSKKTILIIFITGLIVHFICAWYSLGFFHYDEHYQILEFANYKAGYSPAKDLAWEFDARIRPTLQPWIAYYTIKLHALFRPHDSFTVAGILRVFTTVLGFATSLLVTAASFRWFTDLRYRKLVLLLSMFLWFVVFMDARFSSESWAGIFFFSAIALLVLKDALYSKNQDTSVPFIILGGFLIGISLVCRLQMILLLPGLGLWCLFVARTPFKTLLWLFFGGLLALVFGFVLDYLFYGEWVNTAYRYFTTNILEGKAAEFGISPWWFYIPEFLKLAHLPSSFIILLLVVIAWLKYPKHILTFTCVPFVLLHFTIAHKELRFLFPIAHAMPVFLALGLSFFTANIRSFSFQRSGNIIAVVLLVMLGVQNIILLAIISTSPVRPVLKPISYLYRNEKNNDINVLLADVYEYRLLNGLPMNYYVTDNMHLAQHSHMDSIHAYLQTITKPAYFVVSGRGPAFPTRYKGIEANVLETTYYAYPKWYEYININNWLGRTSFWRIYKLKPNKK